VIPPEQNGEFVARMEDVLEIYQWEYDENYPVVCMDEQPTQLVKETRQPIGCKPGKLAKYDYEYERNGTANNFMFTEPLAGWRKVSVREKKTRRDWAEEVQSMLDEDYPDAELVILVCDNLNTHTLGALYETFPPKEAKRLADRIDIRYTPKHGSWLNMAEIELSVLTKQCLSRRIADVKTLRREAAAWADRRNQDQSGVDWNFNAKDARKKLKRLYPQVQMN
jgi:hypothetical protein